MKALTGERSRSPADPPRRPRRQEPRPESGPGTTGQGRGLRCTWVAVRSLRRPVRLAGDIRDRVRWTDHPSLVRPGRDPCVDLWASWWASRVRSLCSSPVSGRCWRAASSSPTATRATIITRSTSASSRSGPRVACPSGTPARTPGCRCWATPRRPSSIPASSSTPLLPYPIAARVYILAHVALAFAGMYRLMRGWSTSQAGSAISAMSYAFGAPVLFQYCNVIFLVGAAWVPFGIGAVDRWLRTGHRASVLALGVVLAMQTLGGDPEAAYVTGLCAGGYAVGLAITRRREARGLAPARLSRIVPATILLLIAWTAIVLVFARFIPGWRPVGPPPAACRGRGRGRSSWPGRGRRWPSSGSFAARLAEGPSPRDSRGLPWPACSRVSCAPHSSCR